MMMIVWAAIGGFAVLLVLVDLTRHLARPFAEAIDIPQAADTHWRRHRSAFCRRGGPPS